MRRDEILATPYGEMQDMISCLSIYEGNAVQKKAPQKVSFDDAMALR